MRLRVPMMAMHSVAAGGGSILHFDGARFRVGPDSAGANPGPMCYRRGGPLAVTDANVMVGKLATEFFPHLFGPDADEALDADAVRAAFAALAKKIGDGRAPEDVADGFIRIAVENMAQRDQAHFGGARAMTREATRSIASAARAGSMPAWWPTRSACGACSFIRFPACCRPMA